MQLRNMIGEATHILLLFLYSQMQLRNHIGEATPFLITTILTNAIEESDRGSNSFFIITILTNAIEESNRRSNSYFFLLLYSQMQLRIQIGEATPTFSYYYIHKCN